MKRYYCPYCHPSYQFQKQRVDGVMVCGQCGDPLVKAPLFRPTKVFALITIAAFIAPLLMMILGYLNSVQKQKPRQGFETSSMFNIIYEPK